METLGEQIMDLQGKITTIRVLEETVIEPQSEAQGTLTGVPVNVLLTARTEIRPDGVMHSRGKWIITGPTGEKASMHGMSVGSWEPDGSLRFRGSGIISSSTPRLSKLNGTAIVFEIDGDPDRHYTMKGWEWK